MAKTPWPPPGRRTPASATAAPLRTALALLCACLLLPAALANTVDVGYDVVSAAQAMIRLASHSWEWGTAAEALLELYNPELSVFGSNPFPDGKVPHADPAVVALAFAGQFIELGRQTLVPDGAVGDPASLGVSAILLGQTAGAYLDAADSQADYLLHQAPKFSNGAISQRGDVAELWADFMFMAPPFLAYQAVQKNDASLMATTVAQCGLYRDVLQAGGAQSWRHIIGPQSQDTGLWSTGNGWAAYGMVRVLHTLQKWSGSSSMTAQAGQLKTWIREILDGAMAAPRGSGGLLPNYLLDASWFGETSGTALLAAAAYRMAVNDPATFGSAYVAWADASRQALASHQAGGGSGIFSPAVNPLNWLDRTPFTSGSPEGQSFSVLLYAAYRDCVAAGVCKPPPPAAPTATTISKPGLGPFEIVTALDAALTFSAVPSQPSGCNAPQSCDADGCAGKFVGVSVQPVCTGGPNQGCPCLVSSSACGQIQSCDLNGCDGHFDGIAVQPVCRGNFKGCPCLPTNATCGPHQDCDLHGCAGKFTGIEVFPTCTGNFRGCQCRANQGTCAPRQSCDLNGCAGGFNGSAVRPVCKGNFFGCECDATPATCGKPQSCDLNGCAGGFNGSAPHPVCKGNFLGCECAATAATCGPRQSCDMNGCNGAFTGSTKFPICTGNFLGCECAATPATCAPRQSCDLNGCAGRFNLTDGKAYCTGNFEGCECLPTAHTCGPPQSCDAGNCVGKFAGSEPYPHCTNFFKGCQCLATGTTCGKPQDCGLNGCEGAFNLQNGLAFCQNNFFGCQCAANPGTCGKPQSCDAGNCAGKFVGNVALPTCTNFFKGCVCARTDATCGKPQSCDLNGCAGGFDANGVARCQGNFQGCECVASSKTCGQEQDCDKNGCAGTFDSQSNTARCRGNFPGCVCKPVASTCGQKKSCSINGCNGAFYAQGEPVCTGNFFGCPCIPDPIFIPPPPSLPPPPPSQPQPTSPSGPAPSGGAFHLVQLESTDDGQFFQSLLVVPSSGDNCAFAMAHQGVTQTVPVINKQVIAPPSNILSKGSFAITGSICDPVLGSKTEGPKFEQSLVQPGQWSFSDPLNGVVVTGHCFTNYNPPGQDCGNGYTLIQLLACQADSDAGFCQSLP